MSADVIIVGAGPAGMTAAIAARGLGLRVIVLDDQEAPGGQIYRNVLSSTLDSILGADFVDGRALVERFLAGDADYRPMSRVWRIDHDGVCYTGSDGSRQIKASHVILATGAMERPVPTLGWTLPGVMTAGAAQVMLKSGGIIAEAPVFVGSGPLLYLVVAQYLRSGMRPKAVLDTTPLRQRAAALRHGLGAMRGWRYLKKGLGLLSEIRSTGVRIERVDDYSFQGTSKLEAIAYRAGSVATTVDCDIAFVHQGVIPAVHASLSTRCAHVWSESQVCWTPMSDEMGRTDVDWLRVAGDGAGIRGATSAGLTGELAVLGIAEDTLEKAAEARQTRAAELKSLLRTDGAARPFLESLYRPRERFLVPNDDAVLLCRCELVTRRAVRDAVSEGCPGPNQLKAFTRSGMGPCQGRICGPIVSSTMAAMTGKSPSEVGHYTIRSPFNPVTLTEIAQLHQDSE
ncbi:NAD(P)/FAD-dependent oxidoreductase [Algicella marina]|nr:FAD/NAD(P)-binding oxidoreductase [Algicella marina]